MLSHRPHPKPFARAHRALAGLAGILLLLLQLLSPALASADEGVWMEICSEAGAVYVQVDLKEDAGDTAPCPECASCVLCAVTGTGPQPVLPEMARPEFVQSGLVQARDVYKPYNPAQFWPDTRGPPAAPETESERAPRASMATIQRSGGALWS